MRVTPGEDGLVVHVGRLVEKKGTLHLIRAMARVRKQCPRSRLIIIGDGPLRALLVREVVKLGLGEAVSFLGALPNHEVLQWIRRAAILVVPSVVAQNGDTEGLPTVVLEAASQGVPVVGSNSGGIAEALKDNVSGFVVPEGDPVALADRICRLLGEEDMRFGMGHQARMLMESRFDLRDQSRKLEDIYDSVVPRRV
jgi:glycosyltransferase involved in cell wall biosynthesis